MERDLIYDVGVNNGDDTAYYLSKGFRVLGIEANPTAIGECQQRFREALEARRLILLNVAIAEEDGVAEFFVSEGNRGVWNSLDAGLAARTGVRPRSVRVPARRFRGVLEEFGVPYFLKLDIEGADFLCLRDIDSTSAPPYVSFEASEARLEHLFWLAAAGYSRFKLIDQLGNFRQVMPPPMHSWPLARTLLGSLARDRLRRVPGLASVVRLVRRLRPSVAARRNAGSFPLSSSGPMPEESDGPWRSLEEVAYAWLYYVRPTTTSNWYDVHAARA